MQDIDWSATTDCEEIVRFFSGLPAQNLRAYELKVTDIAGHCPADRLELFRNILSDEKRSVEARFTAFFVLATHYRRYKNFREYESMVNEFGLLLSDQPMYAHVVGLMYSARGASDDLEQALVLSKRASLSLPSHPGVLHAFASSVAAAGESGVAIDDATHRQAEEAVAMAISIDPTYAKFYCTRGRLLALRGGDWDRAQDDIRKAMDLENEDESDYVLRINEYQHHLTRVQNQEMTKRLESEFAQARDAIATMQSEMENQLHEFRGQSLATLGLFTAILSFTLGSIQIARGQPFDHAARLIIVMAGSLMAVYGVFAMIVRRKHEQGDWPLIVGTLSGIAVVLLALFF